MPPGAIPCLSLAALPNGLLLRVNDALPPKPAIEFAGTLGQASQAVSANAFCMALLGFGLLGDQRAAGNL